MLQLNVGVVRTAVLCTAFLSWSVGAQMQPSCVINLPLDADDPLLTPFAADSIWNRTIPEKSVYVDVQDAIFGDAAEAPTRVNLDLISVAYVDPTKPLVRIENNMGYDHPERASSSGVLLYERPMANDAAIGVAWSKSGNALFTIIDLVTGFGDEGVGSWRCPGKPLLTFNPDSPFGHHIDVISGDGRLGYGRASRLPSLGGAIRMNEMNTGIFHAVAVNLSSRRYSVTNHFVWPASGADDFAASTLNGYFGPNPNYTIGTLLAIPPGVNLNALSWATPQGRIFAQSAQDYGWYITDSGTGGRPGGDLIAMAMEVKAAKVNFGLAIDPDTNLKTIDPSRFDVDGFTRDTLQILTLVKAVVSNVPALAITPIPAAVVVVDNDTFDFAPTVSGTDPVTWRLLSPSSPLADMVFNTKTGVLTWNVDSMALPLTVTIEATSSSGSDSVTSTLVEALSVMPLPSTRTVVDKESISFTPAANTGSGTITWSLASPLSPPSGMNLNTSTGEFTWVVNSSELPLDITIYALSPGGTDRITTTFVAGRGLVPSVPGGVAVMVK